MSYRRDLFCLALFTGIAMALAACGQTVVRPSAPIAAGQLPHPARILIYDVRADEARVTEYNGIMRQQPANPNAVDRRSEIRKNTAAAYQSALLTGLLKLGFRVSRVARGSFVAGPSDLIIDARCLAIDQGDPLRRLLVGFGSGASQFKSLVVVYRGSEPRKLFEFTTLANSGRLPGAAVTLPVGAAVQGGISAALVASGAVGSGVTAYSSDVSQMAVSSADEAVRYLSEFFAAQGWIPRQRVKKARIDYRAPSSNEAGAQQ